MDSTHAPFPAGQPAHAFVDTVRRGISARGRRAGRGVLLADIRRAREPRTDDVAGEELDQLRAARRLAAPDPGDAHGDLALGAPQPGVLA